MKQQLSNVTLGMLPQTVQVVGEKVLTTFGNLLTCEVKRPEEKVRPDQQEFLDRVNQLGGIGLCVHSVEELEEQLGSHLT